MLSQPSESNPSHRVSGSQEENDALCRQMQDAGTFTQLNPETWPGCNYARFNPTDVPRVEDRTFICSLPKDTAGDSECQSAAA